MKHFVAFACERCYTNVTYPPLWTLMRRTFRTWRIMSTTKAIFKTKLKIFYLLIYCSPYKEERGWNPSSWAVADKHFGCGAKVKQRTARPSKCSVMLIHILSGWVEDMEVPQISERKHLQCDVFSAILISLFQTLVSRPGVVLSRDGSQGRASQQTSW